MGLEIERKFLVQGQAWRKIAETGVSYAQGYLTREVGRSVRVRVAGDQGFLTIKSATTGISRREYEYQIPVDEAWELLKHLCYQPLIKKTRYRIEQAPLVWEVDEFWGENQGLILAEVELSHPEQALVIPDWIGREVSQDHRYFNAYLNQHPYQEWASHRIDVNPLTD
ncbi:CYTH domain-containing protein [Synechococcus sp. PCC 6312]|uniref:CYTH domain-containing protein n=1 Tax=Synechococcus sp. (strain ATCC 27167 / PCC 6312) TaxID=195253 RepID=UPI00029EDD43|nr:CYTH domain-containing protein [Synechococcus sp. PCC 6312]AFY61674.1 hypothetical protein Syn6312_2575 [Synechococcus sp. PCC 6312]